MSVETNQNDVERVLEEHYPGLEYIILNSASGLFQEVYIVEVGGERVAVKFEVKESKYFEKGLWGMKFCEDLGIPVAKLIQFDESKNIVPYRYSIVSFLEGEHPNFNNNMETESAYNSMMNSNNGLRLVHSIKTQGFGKLNKEGKGEFESWNAFLEERYEKARKRIIENDLLPQDYIEAFDKIHKYMHGKISQSEGHLMIGDLHHENFFTKNGEFSSFVDLKFLLSGDPLWEYATINSFTQREFWPGYIERNTETYMKFLYYSILFSVKKISDMYEMDDYFVRKGLPDYKDKQRFAIELIDKFEKLYDDE